MVLTLLSRGTGWKLSRRWIKDTTSLFKIAAGATHYGCFGYAVHPVFEVTSMCNLRCIHCHAKGGLPYPGELDTEGAKRAIENLTTVRNFRTLVFTGGEPIVRRDIFELTEFASSLGFNVIYATNATLISREVARRMARSGVVGAAISLDSVNPEKHDWFRGVSGAWRKALEGIKNVLDEGMYLQINITVSKMNYEEVPDLIRFSDKLGAHVILLYTFIPFGRGEIYQKLSLTPEEYAKLVEKVAEVQGDVELVISPIALPWYYAYVVAHSNLPLKVVRRFVTGCISARGMFYIKPDGEVWPCPFLPLSAGNVAKQPAIEIWNSMLFKRLRDRSNLEEPCRSCIFREVCGGCRARAYIETGNPFAADPTCRLRDILLKTAKF